MQYINRYLYNLHSPAI